MTEEGFAWLGTGSWIQSKFWEANIKDHGEWENFSSTIARGSLGSVASAGHGPKFEEYFARFSVLYPHASEEPYAGYAYDATWAFGHALHQLLEIEGRNVSDVGFRRRLNSALFNVDFEGVTGRVGFDEVGDREDILYDIMNFRKNGSLQTVGSWSQTKGMKNRHFRF